jgi:hypothetical protein
VESVTALVPADLKDKTVTVAIYNDGAPQQFLENGKLVGIQPNFADFGITKERQETIDMVFQFVSPTGFAAQKGSDLTVDEQGDLCGLGVAVPAGSSFLGDLGTISDLCVANGGPALVIQTFPTQTDGVFAEAIKVLVDRYRVRRPVRVLRGEHPCHQPEPEMGRCRRVLFQRADPPWPVADHPARRSRHGVRGRARYHLGPDEAVAHPRVALVGLALNEGAYRSEIIRGGIQSVDPGQDEAAIPLLIVASLWYLIVTTVFGIGQYYVERHFARGARRQQSRTPLQGVREGMQRMFGTRKEEQP